MLWGIQMALKDAFARYVLEATGQAVTWGKTVFGELPGYLAHRYSLIEAIVAQRRVLVIVLLEPEGFTPARFEKQLSRLLEYADGIEDFCLLAAELPSYVRRRLLERQLPFVVPGRQLSWPALGAAARARASTRIQKPVPDKLWPASQAVMIGALGGHIPGRVTARTLATQLGYAAMTMSRALDEIEVLGLARVSREGRQRWVTFADDRRSLWENASAFMRSPVRELVHIRHQGLPISEQLYAGESALAALSMLSPPQEPVFALGPKAWRRIAKQVEHIPIEDVGTCQVQVWRYDPALFARNGAVDPFSLYLSLRDESDPRVEMALERLMEELVW